LEYWIIDGGSTDDTVEILRSYGEKIHWISEPDNGQSNAVNKGWARAQGDILGWVNADDLLRPSSVELAVTALLENPSCGAVYGDSIYIDEEGHFLEPYPTRAFDYEKLVTETENFISQPSVFIRAHLLHQIGFLDENLHYVMDYDFWLRLGCVKSMLYIPVDMAALRLHTQAKTIQSMQHFSNEFSFIFERLISNPAFPESLKQQREEILYTAYLHSASFCFWGGNTRLALAYLRKAWLKRPFPLGRTFWLLLLFSLCGKMGGRLAVLLHGNPMRLEKGLLTKWQRRPK
jgi:glycosyltransferase involved in cell wall biosynthesis